MKLTNAIAVRDQYRGSTAKKLVLYMFALSADENDGTACPSVGTVARHCGIGERYTRKLIADLIAEGTLVRVKHSAGGPANNTSEYVIRVRGLTQ